MIFFTDRCKDEHILKCYTTIIYCFVLTLSYYIHFCPSTNIIFFRYLYSNIELYIDVVWDLRRNFQCCIKHDRYCLLAESLNSLIVVGLSQYWFDCFNEYLTYMRITLSCCIPVIECVNLEMYLLMWYWKYATMTKFNIGFYFDKLALLKGFSKT